MKDLRQFALETILLMFPEFKLRVYCYAKVTDVINVSRERYECCH